VLEDTPNHDDHGIGWAMSTGVQPRRAKVLLAAIGMGALVACEKEPSKLEKLLEASTHAEPPEAAPPPVASAPAAASAGPADASTWDGAMPPRPIPKPAMTVGSGMPAETQMKAIAYMAAMGQPGPGDANADPDYAAALAVQLKPIIMSMDKGPAEEKLRLDRVEVVASGRRIDLLMADGCDARAPQQAAARAGATFVTLQSHGVLVVRCNDSHVQCLQSTRDPSDVLCTTAPRHR
jgi:hypothetical protein